MHLRPVFLNVVFVLFQLVLFLFAEASLAQTVSPLGFVQRRDVGQQINLQPEQLEIVRRLEPICDAQCQARVMDMLMNVPAELQSQFLAQSPEERAQTAAGLTRAEQENIETEMLSDNVLDEQQVRRFLELRTQFLGNDSFLSDRISSLLGLSSDQIAELRTVQDAGTGLINACQSIPGLSAGEQQQGITLIQNNLIDQSINILNGAQIEIFVNLCGEGCDFDLPGEPESPAEPEASPEGPVGGEESVPTGPDGVESVGQSSGGREGSGLRTIGPAQSPSDVGGSGRANRGNQPRPRRTSSQTAPVERGGGGSSTRTNRNASQGSSSR